ncbi:unnamed protein product [Phytophthora fragariaefolia]|uniref:Unnamed protein product n=1 Tax=Phytophthora fragariaefolia TaxID=1490495 RepID=A0A9W6YFG9_9STRA|nr:unnamed protein product [Phytophthora fragariaefolia]
MQVCSSGASKSQSLNSVSLTSGYHEILTSTSLKMTTYLNQVNDPDDKEPVQSSETQVELPPRIQLRCLVNNSAIRCRRSRPIFRPRCQIQAHTQVKFIQQDQIMQKRGDETAEKKEGEVGSRSLTNNRGLFPA